MKHHVKQHQLTLVHELFHHYLHQNVQMPSKPLKQTLVWRILSEI